MTTSTSQTSRRPVHRARPPARRPDLLRPGGGRRAADPGHPGRRRDLPDRQGLAGLTASAADLPDGKSFLSLRRRPSRSGRSSPPASRSSSAAPLAVAVSLYVAFYAPRRLAAFLGYVDQPPRRDPEHHLRALGHRGARPRVGRSAGVAGRPPRVHPPVRRPGLGHRAHDARRRFVLGIMILPIISAITREVFFRTPRAQIEGALALGATRWEMIRMAVLPFGRSGHHRRLDARARARAGRDDGRDDHPVGVRRGHLQPDLVGQPLDDRRQHRARSSPSPRASTSTR